MKKRIINLVNFVRGCEPRDPNTDLLTPIAEELAINKAYGFDHTVLIQYDALIRPDFRQLFLGEADEHTEFGLWFEMGRPLVEAVGIEWRGRPGYDWDWYVNPGFLPAYTPDERERIIDEAFRLFKEIFGYYPVVAGSWLIDAHSAAYMNDRYGMKALCICREQYAVDAYTLWGGYYNGGYYPARQNLLCPAQTAEQSIPTPVFRMLGIDPLFGYDENKYAKKLWGCPTMEPVWGPGSRPEVVDWFMNTYYQNPCLAFSHMTTGQENSFGWPAIGAGYKMQAEKIAALRDAGILSVEKMGDTGAAFQAAYDLTPATALCATDDWTDGNHQTTWYSCANYRCNLFLHEDKLIIRDINKFDENYPERYLTEACTTWDARYDNLPIVDSRLWSNEALQCAMWLDRPVSSLSFAEEDDTLAVNVHFKDGDEGRILLTPKSMIFDTEGHLRCDLGTPEAKISLDGDTFKYDYRGFTYALPVTASITLTEEGYILSPKDGKIILQLA